MLIMHADCAVYARGCCCINLTHRVEERGDHTRQAALVLQPLALYAATQTTSRACVKYTMCASRIKFYVVGIYTKMCCGLAILSVLKVRVVDLEYS